MGLFFEKEFCLFLNTGNVTNDGFNFDENVFISEEKHRSLRKGLLQRNDTVLTTRGTIGNTAFYSTNIPFERVRINSGMLILRPNSDELSPDYFYQVMKSDVFQSQAMLFRYGAAQSQLPIATLKHILLPLPPLTIQQKIARILSAYDDLIENNLKRIKLLEEMAQITYEQWFVRMRFPGHEATPMDAETGLPGGWEKRKIGELLCKLKVTIKIKSSDYSDEGGTPIIDQSKRFIAGYTDNADAIINSERPIIIFGDHTRAIKFVNFSFARGADGTQLILSNDKRMPQHLFYFSLLCVDLSNYHYARHFKFLKASEVIVPDVNSASVFEAKAKKSFDGIKFLHNQNQLLKEARDILLPRLMTGMIDVDEIDLPPPVNMEKRNFSITPCNRRLG